MHNQVDFVILRNDFVKLILLNSRKRRGQCVI